MRSVYQAANLIDAHLVRHALEDAGIAAFVRGEALTGGMGELGVFGLLAVMVADEQWAQAREVVEGLGFGAAIAEEEDVPRGSAWPA
ncbi:MAG: DUF2007 domain-containing protein [Pseudomonadota bacterium]